MNIVLLLLILSNYCYCQTNNLTCKLLIKKIQPIIYFQKQLEEEYNETAKFTIFGNSRHSVINPIRIKFIYSDVFNALSYAQWLKTNFIELVGIEIQKSIGIKYKMDSPLRLPRHCPNITYINGQYICSEKCSPQTCNDEDVPIYLYKKCPYYDTDGKLKELPEGRGSPNTDLIISVSYIKDCSGAVAMALPCYLGLKNRPIYGRLVICPSVQSFFTSSPDQIIAILQHEIFHILGFHSELLNLFVYPNGTEILSKNILDSQIIKQINRSRKSIYENYTRSFYSFQMPKTLNYARKYFNCPSLQGVDMEDLDGVDIGHFDELVYFYELMSPIISEPGTEMTPLSLAFLEDTGWYYVNYFSAVETDYGKDSGCIFAEKGCLQYMEERDAKQKSIYPYCDRYLYDYLQNNIYCSKDRKYKQECLLYLSGVVDRRYIYFNKINGYSENESKLFTGNNEYSEYCPILYGYARGSNCRFPEKKDDTINDVLQNYYGNDSMCFINNVVPHPVKDFVGAACLKYRAMSGTSGSVVFYYKEKEYICTHQSQITIQEESRSITVYCSDLNFVSPNSLGNTLSIFFLILLFTIVMFISQTSFDYLMF